MGSLKLTPLQEGLLKKIIQERTSAMEAEKELLDMIFAVNKTVRPEKQIKIEDDKLTWEE